MNSSLVFVANWKMGFSFNQTVEFVTNHYKELATLSRNHQVILCPLSMALPDSDNILKGTTISLGAQDCSNYAHGAYTGQISAESIKQAGAQFCIIGHSERRKYNNETNEIIAQKLVQLLDQEITPIICIGETLEQFNNNQTVQVLEEQLAAIFEIIQERETQNKLSKNNKYIFIAYEPVWSIGTGLIPNPENLTLIFAQLHEKTQNSSSSIVWRLLYGGSVKSDNVKSLALIRHLGGFLIGGASLDFQELKKIVECNDERICG